SLSAPAAALATGAGTPRGPSPSTGRDTRGETSMNGSSNGSDRLEHRADIVIVGAGAAGAMAAPAAYEQGATFVGLDQLPEFGGTAIVSGGGMSVAGSSMQAEKGIEDSPDRAFHDMVDEQSEADQEWARFYYERGAEQLLGWLHDQGVEFNTITLNEGDSVPRRHVPKGVGLGLMTRLW